MSASRRRTEPPSIFNEDGDPEQEHSEQQGQDQDGHMNRQQRPRRSNRKRRRSLSASRTEDEEDETGGEDDAGENSDVSEGTPRRSSRRIRSRMVAGGGSRSATPPRSRNPSVEVNEVGDDAPAPSATPRNYSKRQPTLETAAQPMDVDESGDEGLEDPGAGEDDEVGSGDPLQVVGGSAESTHSDAVFLGDGPPGGIPDGSHDSVPSQAPSSSPPLDGSVDPAAAPAEAPSEEGAEAEAEDEDDEQQQLEEEECRSRERWNALTADLEHRLEGIRELDGAYRWSLVSQARLASDLEVRDRIRAADPELDRKFDSFEDAWERLAAFHVYQAEIPGNAPGADAEFRRQMDRRADELHQHAWELAERHFAQLAREAANACAVDHLGLGAHAIEAEQASLREQERSQNASNIQLRQLNDQQRQLLEQQRQIRNQLQHYQQLEAGRQQRQQEALRQQQLRQQDLEQQRLMQARMEAMQHSRDYNM